MKKLLAITLLTGCAALTGCATLMNGPQQQINIQTVPPGAECSLDRYRFVTPGVVMIPRDNAPVLTAVCELPGYNPVRITLRSRTSSWFYGNVATGILPGIIVDGLTGGANIYEPNVVQVKLERAP
jgi:hypothetical protein